MKWKYFLKNTTVGRKGEVVEEIGEIGEVGEVKIEEDVKAKVVIVVAGRIWKAKKTNNKLKR